MKFWQWFSEFDFSVGNRVTSVLNTQCGKTQDTVKKNELTKDLWNMNDYNVNE